MLVVLECELVKCDLSRYDPGVPSPAVLRQCGHRESQVSVGCKVTVVGCDHGSKGMYKKNFTG